MWEDILLTLAAHSCLHLIALANIAPEYFVYCPNNISNLKQCINLKFTKRGEKIRF